MNFGVVVLLGSVAAVAQVVFGVILLFFWVELLEEGEINNLVRETFHGKWKNYFFSFHSSGDMTEPVRRVAHSRSMRGWM